MNKSDTERIFGILSDIGYNKADIPENADLLIINTCSIRAAAENKAYSYLGVWGKWKKSKPDLKIAMCGCVAQHTKESIFKRAPYIDLIFGTHNIPQLPELISKLDFQENVYSILQTPYEPNGEFSIIREKGISAWLPIIEGCDYFCTYCIVPYTRGRQRSRKPQDIIQEARNIANEGYKEIVLLGQTVDSYGKDFKDENITLSNLLRELNKIENILRIRFVTSHPADITDELISTVKELDKVCEYFHIPMQSGNTEVLKQMKRRYSREEYLVLVEKIRAQMPNVGITSDFIAGFPRETEKQFEDTLSIIEQIGFDHCNTAAYSPRKRTPAAVWKEQLPQEAKKSRLNLLNEQVKQSTIKSNEKYIGKILEILAENYNEVNGETILNGRSRNNKIVHFLGKKELIGQLINVEIQESSIWCLKGQIKSLDTF
ncbi:MAG: tRNA (N6-isopentenyl adenosine(37)-C2)-methylthiotransferase MiaB [Candidatus Melainabacteria bacterium RIFOXYA12_FULL_32_12]|nr:MAG: tRNA (N6-isopentenyl adenosine(37)-C2)-methylthiotransferase MiaB [Candidatus Melainabacteria bacterium RIFOXYA12_FULL_32_12]